MPKYSELLPDNEIVSMLGPQDKNVVLLACGGCINESLAFKYSMPIISYGDKETYPAIESECKRLTRLLTDNGVLVTTFYLPPGTKCIRDLDDKPFLIPEDVKPDIILVLSCPDGIWGLSRNIKGVPLIRISKWVEIMFYRYRDDGKLREIERGTISKFSIAT